MTYKSPTNRNKKLYLVMQIEKDGEWYAQVKIVYSSDNIAKIIADINPQFANIYTTKKDAYNAYYFANACFSANGFYKFEPYLKGDI